MIFFEKLDRIQKFIKAAFFGFLAVVVCWRGASFKDPLTAGATPALMCFVAGTALMFLAISILLAKPAPVSEESAQASSGSTAGSFS